MTNGDMYSVYEMVLHISLVESVTIPFHCLEKGQVQNLSTKYRSLNKATTKIICMLENNLSSAN